MDEETKTNTEGTESQDTDGDSNQGNQPKVSKKAESDNEAAKRLEEATKQILKANKEKQRLNADEAERIAKEQLGGQSEAGIQTPEKKKLTDEEYADAMTRGEVNPLKDDGYI